MPDANGEPLEAERRELENALAGLNPEAPPDIDALATLIARAYPNQIGSRFNVLERVCAGLRWKGDRRKTLDKAITAAARVEKHRAGAEHGSDPALRLAGRMVDKYEGRLLYDGQAFRSYTGTHWQGMTLDRVQHEVIELGTIDAARQNRNGQLSALPHLMEGTLKLLRPMAAKNVPAAARDRERVLINVENGTLEFDRVTWQPKLRPHDPDDAIFHTLNVEHDPEATCPTYDKLVREIFARTFYVLDDNDADHDAARKVLKQARADSFEERHTFAGIEFDGAESWHGRTGWIEAGEVLIVDIEENVRLYEEIAGYVMTPYRGFNKFVLFHGREGINGKSTLSRLIKKFVPEETIQAIPDIGTFLQSPFSFTQLKSKLLVICDDMNNVPLGKYASFIKQLSWNTDLSSDVKHSTEFSNFMNTSLLFLIGNDMGSSKGLGPAFLDRVLLLDFNMVFRRDDSIWDGVFQQPSELAGVFQRFVNGLSRAMRRGTIAPTRALQYALSRWVAEYDAFEAHLQEYSTTSRDAAGVHGNSEGSSVSAFHNSFSLYWREQRIAGHPPTRVQYLKTLRKMSKLAIGESGAQPGAFYIRGRWLRPEKDFPFAFEPVQNVFPFDRDPEQERIREDRLREREDRERRGREERDRRAQEQKRREAPKPES